jgi:hypothetical protein
MEKIQSYFVLLDDFLQQNLMENKILEKYKNISEQ